MGLLQIGVLGAGIVGLTTALELQKQFPTACITVIADKFNEDTTSHGAAGIFRPGSSFCGPTEEITKQWIRDSYTYYEDLHFSDQSPLAGVSQISGYIFSSRHESIVHNHLLEPLVPVYRTATPEELKLCCGEWKYGSFFTTFLTECSKFLPWAMERFRCSGGNVQKRTVLTLNELAEDFDIIVNCLGLGSKYVCSDHKVVPIRGQIMKVDAPWIKTFFYGDYDTYVIPSSTGVVLGGCRQFESFDVNLSSYDRAAILQRCYNFIPSLKMAPILHEWAGLRPYRSTVRVEPEMINAGINKLKVVHNYGHGGYGVTSAPGTSQYAAKLVCELHSANSKL